MPAAFAYINYADAGVITASSSALLMQPAKLQHPIIARKWRGLLGGSEYLTIDLGASYPVDTVALFGLNLSLEGTTRVRASLTDATAQIGELYDSGNQVGKVDPYYTSLIHLLPSAVTARYVRIDLADSHVGCIEAGRLFVGKRVQPEVNFSAGWSKGWTDRSRITEGFGGQEYVDKDVSYRSVEITFEFLSDAERYGFVEEMDLLNGQSTDVLFIEDTGSSNLGRDSIWGLMRDNQAVVQPYSVGLFRKSYRIRERL